MFTASASYEHTNLDHVRLTEPDTGGFPQAFGSDRAEALTDPTQDQPRTSRRRCRPGRR